MSEKAPPKQKKKRQPKQKKKKKKSRSEGVKSSFENFTSKLKCGEKKDVSGEIPPSYLPAHAEDGWYDWWSEKGYFTPQKDSDKPPYVIMLPPPNVTGNLHIGHALTSAIQDCMIRFHKMKGRNVLYLPGVDHAGIATQVVVEKQLRAKEGKSRHDLGRDAFVEKVWEWKREYGKRINEQLKRMGSSLDWTRERFTMDEGYVKAVREAFIRMYGKGLIYRDKRLVNWDCTLMTAVSNIEVDMVELTGENITLPGYPSDYKIPMGYLWTFGYPLEDGSGHIYVSTTRPETMLGDTAVAVHPDDERYKNLHGKFVIHPFQNRKIPIITDTYVLKDFGTGAVKITPAHDPNDFELGKRHKLEFINIINDDGTMNENAGSPFSGMKRYYCREKVVKMLDEKGLLGTKDGEFKKREVYKLVVGICSRSKDVIEPLIKPQWYVRCEELGKKSIEAVRSGKLKIFPKVQKQKWFSWMEGIHDWCISRQLWWGHRIPAFFIKIDGIPIEEEEKRRCDSKYWSIAETREAAQSLAEKQFPGEKFVLEQDEDVLDTWFSSGLFPFATLGWPEKTVDLEKFFPGSLLETGWDILFFWVARMVMMSMALTDKLPFEHVYLHSMVRDKEGKKMSKSDGNIIDPIDCIEGISLSDLHKKLQGMSQLDEAKKKKGVENQKSMFPDGIPECGTDALRFTLINYITNSGVDINMDVQKVFAYRTFCNKIWNATRFAMLFGGVQNYVFQWDSKKDKPPKIEYFMNRWILAKLEQLVEICNETVSNYKYHEYTNAMYDFFLKAFCDDYVEAVKPIIKRKDDPKDLELQETRFTLFLVLERFFRLLHPTMPFLSEELWQRLTCFSKTKNELFEESIMVSEYPSVIADFQNLEILEEYNLIKKVVVGIRSIKGRYGLKRSQSPKTFIITKNEKEMGLLGRNLSLIKVLSCCGDLLVVKKREDITEKTGQGLIILSDSISVVLILKGMIDTKKEMTKLETQRKNKVNYIAKSEGKMKSQKFIDNTPVHIKQRMQENLNKAKKELELILKMIEDLKKLEE